MSTLLVENIKHEDAASPAITLLANGNVGVGTISPQSTLHVTGHMILEGDSGVSRTLGFTNASGSTGWSIGNGIIDNTHNFRIYDNTAGQPRVTVNGSGNVGIGTSSPSNALRVVASPSQATTDGAVVIKNEMNNGYETLKLETNNDRDSILSFRSTGTNSYWWGMGIDNSDGGKFKMGADNLLGVNNRLVITQAGSVGIGTDTPDSKLDISGVGVGETQLRLRTGSNTNSDTTYNQEGGRIAFYQRQDGSSYRRNLDISANGDNSWGGEIRFLTNPDSNGTSSERMRIDQDGGVHFNNIATPMIKSTGHFNTHYYNSPQGNFGDWVHLGGTQSGAAAGYARRMYKIAQHREGINGTMVYQIWHNGDANYYHGSVQEIRLNSWYSAGRTHHTSVAVSHINGRKDDIQVLAYANTNGIWITTTSIWGGLDIRRFGWDDGLSEPGAAYCAVSNGGPLAIADTANYDGTLPGGYTTVTPGNGYSLTTSSTFTA